MAPSKSSGPPKSASSDSKTLSASSAGPISEAGLRAFLLQKSPITTQDLVAKFRGKLKNREVRSLTQFLISVFYLMPFSLRVANCCFFLIGKS